jgi:hypothetical protein
MRRVILTALESQLFAILIHLLKEKEDLGMVPELRRLN